MVSAVFPDLGITNAENFISLITRSEDGSNLYLSFGRVQPWSNESSPDPVSTVPRNFRTVWDNIVGAKKISGSDISIVVPRYNWQSGTVYSQYDDEDPNLLTTNNNFYIVTSEYNVYKCLNNNNGSESTVEPLAVNPESTSETGDGYIWKYMYTISEVNQLKFTTKNYIPVKTLSMDDGSLQWQVQESSLSGAIHNIIITNSGSGYTNANSVSVSVNGDGTSFSGNVVLEDNSVSRIVITGNGENYTFANVSIMDNQGNGSGATGRAIISPPGGHGSDPLYELYGKTVLINSTLNGTEGGIIPVDNDFRQVSIIKNPISRTTGNVVNSLILNQCYELTLAGTGDYVQDELAYQGPNLAGATFRGRVVAWYPDTGIILLINTIGNPSASQSIIGNTSTTSRIVSNAEEPNVRKYTGKVLYVNNVLAINRDLEQAESFKILIGL